MPRVVLIVLKSLYSRIAVYTNTESQQRPWHTSGMVLTSQILVPAKVVNKLCIIKSIGTQTDNYSHLSSWSLRLFVIFPRRYTPRMDHLWEGSHQQCHCDLGRLITRRRSRGERRELDALHIVKLQSNCTSPLFNTLFVVIQNLHDSNIKRFPARRQPTNQLA